MISLLRSILLAFLHMFRRRATVQYPEKHIYLPARWRGRIILTRDPQGDERCVACYLCAVVCPVACIALQAGEREGGRRYPVTFRINFSRCIFCGLCEDACPTCAIQLTPDFEMAEYDRQNMVYEKEDLLIDTQGKYPGYDFYSEAGIAFAGRGKGEGRQEEPPTDVLSLLPDKGPLAPADREKTP
jgi:NADH-quinone oxidoreductase subunit I